MNSVASNTDYEPISASKDISLDNNTNKTHRKYTKRDLTKNAQTEMKLFSVYAANGWDHVDGTLITETEDSAKEKALKLLRIDEEEKENITIIIHEIKTGIRLVR